MKDLQRLPKLAEETLRASEGPAWAAAERLAGARMISFLGAGPNEASAKFGAAKLFSDGSRGITSVSRRTMSSGFTPSASALKLVMMRWRSTGGATARTSSHET